MNQNQAATLQNPKAPALLECIHLTKVFAGRNSTVQALSDISLKVCKGDFVSITGKNGSGKSTLMGILSGMDRPTSGSVVFDGLDLGTATEARLTGLRSNRIGFVFQDFNLIRGYTAYENVEAAAVNNGLSALKNKASITGLLEKLRIAHRAGHYPAELSAGEQQRIALARALVNKPAILFADEPTGDVDPDSAKEISELLVALNGKEQLTVILTTHGTFDHPPSSRRYFMSKGKFVSQEEAGF